MVSVYPTNDPYPACYEPPSFQILRQVGAGEVVLTQVAVSSTGRLLFVGTSSGAIRAVKFPLSDPGEWAEHQVHSAAVSRVRLDSNYMCRSLRHTLFLYVVKATTFISYMYYVLYVLYGL